MLSTVLSMRGLSREDQATVLSLAAARVKARNREVEERFRGVPLPDFVRDQLGAAFWSKQNEIAEAITMHQRVAVRSCHGVGKSYSIARVAVAYLQTHPHSIVLTTAPSSTQVREITWRNIRQTYFDAPEKLRAKRGHPLQTKWEIEADWYALGVSPGKNNSGLQGFHAENILVIIDEAAGVGEHIYEQVEGLMTGENARLVLIGNPTSYTGSFRRAFHQSRDLYHTITISAEDTPNFTAYGVTREDVESGAWQEKVTGPYPFPGLVDPRWAAAQIALSGKDHPYVLSRVWAEFPTGGDFTLIPLSDIERAERVDVEDMNTNGVVCIGIDVARYGEDETVMWARQGELTIGWRTIVGADFNIAYAAFEDLLSTLDVSKDELEVRVDSTGVGGGLADILKGHGFTVKEVNFSEASSDSEQWKFAIHEYWWQLAERFRDGRIGFEGEFDEVTKAQLSDIRYAYLDGRSKPTIERKKDAKKRGRQSPDRAEAMMLAYATLVEKTTLRGTSPLVGRVVRRPGVGGYGLVAGRKKTIHDGYTEID